MTELTVVYRAPGDLKPYEQNSRTHTAEQIAQVRKSIGEFGFTNPILLKEDGITIGAGHARHAASLLPPALDKVPTITLRDLSEDQWRAYVIADNKLALNAGWNEDLLRAELIALTEAGFPMELTGFSAADLAAITNLGGEDSRVDETPELRPEIVSKLGDIWLLGNHRIMCGDSTNAENVAALMDGEIAPLLHADPPYGMGKESDGVENDNLYEEKLDEFQMNWWRAFRPHMTGNASAYIWGNAPELWALWYRGGLGATEPMTLRNEIVWDKGSIAGMASDQLSQFPPASERCLFFQLGRYVFTINQTKADYWPGWEPIRLYLVGEKDRAGFKAGDVHKICGNWMHGHWFGTSQWMFISEEHYGKLRDASSGACFTRPYSELRDEYKKIQAIFNGEIRDDRREDFDAARPYFDNAHDIMRDVWPFNRVTGEDRWGHATPKPVLMIERVMRSSLREGELCAEPFGGTGATLIAAERAGRRCFTMEIQPQYADVIVRRWEKFTGGGCDTRRRRPRILRNRNIQGDRNARWRCNTTSCKRLASLSRSRSSR